MDESDPILGGGKAITKVVCKWNDLECQTSQVASNAFQGAIGELAESILTAVGDVVTAMGTMWVNVKTPNFTASGAEVSAVDAGSYAVGSWFAVNSLLGYLMWVSVAIAVLSLIALGGLLAVRMRRGEGVAAMGKLGLILGGVLMISSASAIVSAVVPAGPSNAGGAVLFIQSGLWWYMGAAAAVSVIIGGLRMVWEQRAEPGRDTVKGLLTLVLVAGAGTTVIGILVAAADGFATWILDKSLLCDTGNTTVCFSENLTLLLGLGVASGAVSSLGPFLLIILGLFIVLTSVVQIILMFARGGMLVILAGILPLSASFTNTEMGKTWFRKSIAWLVAFILYKPAAAIIYATAFQLAGSDLTIDGGDALFPVLTGLMLMLIAVFALPALMRFTTPMVGAMAAGGGGAGGAMAVGAMAAIPTGAAARRTAGGGSSSASGSAGAAGSSGSSKAGATGSAGTGSSSGSGSPGATGSASTGSSGGSGTTGSAGAGSTGASGAGSGAAKAGAAGAAGSTGAGGAAASGAGAASGGAAARGAAAGPAGVGAAAAVQAGQAAAGAIRSVGEQSTSEGGGPDGSR